MTGYIYESSYDTNSKIGKDIEHLKSDFDEIGVKLLLECEKSYALLGACKIAFNLLYSEPSPTPETESVIEKLSFAIGKAEQ